MDLDGIRTAYCIGIKGAGVSSLAQLLAARGVRVSGSDTAEHYMTEDGLRAAGVSFTEGFAAANVPTQVDLVVRSTAYDDDHVEVAEALRRGLRVMSYPEAVAAIFNAGKAPRRNGSAGRGIAVCGTHGKTTTTAMLGLVLAEAGLDPTVIVGAPVPQLGGGMRAGRSDIVVLEADEYQDKLSLYQPFGVILTSIEWDHPDFFPTADAYRDAFARFVAKIPAEGFLVANDRDHEVLAVMRLAKCRVIKYSHILENVRMSLVVPGEHNQQNAHAALAAAELLGVPRDVALRALASYRGATRRFEVIAEQDDIVIIDDYAHHPSEIRATVAAARERFPDRRIITAFQPHTFTRTIALRDDFSHAFAGAAEVLVMDIFGSAREHESAFMQSQISPPEADPPQAENLKSQIPPITAVDLAADIAAQGVPARASGGVAETVAALAVLVHTGDVVLCLGAGVNDKVARGLAAVLAERSGMPR